MSRRALRSTAGDDIGPIRTTIEGCDEDHGSPPWAAGGSTTDVARPGTDAVCAFGAEGMMRRHDKVFAGSVPRIYETYLVPLIFQSYAADLVGRLKPRNPSRILEVVAGTGVVTRALSSALSAGRPSWPRT